VNTDEHRHSDLESGVWNPESERSSDARLPKPDYWKVFSLRP